MAAGHPAGFTLDGPRGPACKAQPGAVWLAKATGNPVVPFHIEASPFWTVRSWDRDAGAEAMQPVVLAVGAPLDVPANADADDDRAKRVELERASIAAPAAALQLLA